MAGMEVAVDWMVIIGLPNDDVKTNWNDLYAVVEHRENG